LLMRAHRSLADRHDSRRDAEVRDRWMRIREALGA
jgi:hypothetical protein